MLDACNRYISLPKLLCNTESTEHVFFFTHRLLVKQYPMTFGTASGGRGKAKDHKITASLQAGQEKRKVYTRACKFDHEGRIVVASSDPALKTYSESVTLQEEQRVIFSSTLFPDSADRNWIPYLRVCRERFAYRLFRYILATSVSQYTLNVNLKIIQKLPDVNHWEQFVVWNGKEERLDTLRLAKKRAISNKFRTKALVSEKHLMFCCEFPFVADFITHFQTTAMLFMLLEYFPGGDIQSRTEKLGKMPPDQARFYAAQVILALEYLHAMGIVLRELRPKSIWICKDGYIKLGDLANAVRIPDGGQLADWIQEYKPGTKSNRALGSQPPEVWLAQPYDERVDWWVFGLFLYELYSGSETFPDEPHSPLYEEQMKQKIFNLHYDTPRWFGNLDKKILKQLLVLNPKDRLGAGDEGITAIKLHPWFKGISWINLYAGTEKAPWIPINAYEDADPSDNFIPYSDDAEIYTTIKNPLPFGYQFQHY